MVEKTKGGVSKRAIMRALSDVLKSRYFADSPQLSDFLRYIVTKTVDGHEGEIKAYTIAVDALGRAEDFDPQTNAAVRVAAGRLRQALALYNAELGDANALRISLAPGSYIPTFSAPASTGKGEEIVDDLPAETISSVEVAETNPILDAQEEGDPGQTSAAKTTNPVLQRVFVSIGIIALALGGLYFLGDRSPTSGVQEPSRINAPGEVVKTELARNDVDSRPSLQVTWNAADSSYPDWFRAGPVVESLRIILARFDDYEFKGIKFSTERNLEDFLQGDADYHFLIKSYRSGEQVRIYGQMFDEQTGEAIWSAEESYVESVGDELRDIPDTVGKMVAPLVSPYGVIYSSLAKKLKTRERLDCVVATLRYFNAESDEKHEIARSCAEERLAAGSQLSSIHAALVFLYLDEYRTGRNRRERDPLQAALEMATRSVELSPTSARAHQALFAVQKVMGLRDLARKSAMRAVELNPYDMDILADYAAWLISIGDNKAGRKALRRVEEIISARPAWLEFFRFLTAELDEGFDEADAVAALFDMRRSPLLAMAVAISAHRRGDPMKATAALNQLVKSEPMFGTNPAQSLKGRGFDDSVVDNLVTKLQDAGLVVQPPKQ